MPPLDRAALLKDETFGDSFQRADATCTLLRTLHRLPPPGCIALYGSWGSGKTTLLRQTFNEWRNQRQPAVWFDPWEYERKTVLAPLLSKMVQQAQGVLDTEKMKRLAFGVARTLAALSVRVGAQYAFGGMQPPFDVLKDLKADDITSHFDGLAMDHDEIESTKNSFQELVDQILTGHAEKEGRKRDDDDRLAIFLDDADRCLPDNVVLLLEGVKLLLCGDLDGDLKRPVCPVVFIFALDRQVVGEAIATRYPGSTSYTGESYLEKIFDVSLEVPPVSPADVTTLILHRCEGMGAPMGALLDKLGGAKMMAETLADPAFGNPRVIKRVLNRMLLLATQPGAPEALGALFVRLEGSDARRDAEARRFVAWVSGIERFRAFRSAFSEASVDELTGLHDRVAGRNRVASGLGRFAKIADTPAFGRYYELIGLRALDPGQLDRERRPGERGSLTLRDYDDLLRRSGL